MTILVTGSAGHLGEGLMRTLKAMGRPAIGIDILPSPYTDHVGTLTDRNFVANCMKNVEGIIHAATLHKPHVATHTKQDFVDVNITGTLNLLEEAHARNLRKFVFTSTTSTFGDALSPPPDEPAAWITEDVIPIPKNIYGVTKLAAENLAWLFYKKHDLPCIILRTSRFFPEDDDKKETREAYSNENTKINELLIRRADLEDVVEAHLLAYDKAPEVGYEKLIVSSTSPFSEKDLLAIRQDPSAVIEQYTPFQDEFARRGWRMFPSLDRVYVNDRAQAVLDWTPKYTFQYALDRLRQNHSPVSQLSLDVGAKGYHQKIYSGDGPYPVD